MGSRRHVAVVGAGLAGATAARAIADELPDADVTVFESSTRVGGKLCGAEVAGVTVDVGAEAMLTRRPEAVGLAEKVGLGDKIVHPEPVGASLWVRGELRPIPPSVMGVPADLDALARSGTLSRAGMLRARADLGLPAPHEDVSVATFVGRRLGREVVDVLVEPLLGGVYAGHAAQLSVRAAAPAIWALHERGTRLAHAAAESVQAAPTGGGPVFAGLDGGLWQLPQTVADHPGVTVRTRATVREVVPHEGGRWQLVVGPANAAETVEADAVVLATPAAATARLLGSCAPVAARALREIDYASMAIVTLAVPRDQVAYDVPSSGFLVPPVEGRTIKASTFSSQKWGWLGKRAGDLMILRASLGRAGEEHVLQRDDADLVATVMADLAEAIGLRGPLVDVHVQRWGGGLPQYNVGHLGRVAEIHAAVDAIAGLAVCGAAYDGVGIPLVAASAQRAAKATLTHLAEAPGKGGQ